MGWKTTYIFTHVHPTINVSSLIKDIKLASSDMIKKNRLFDHFEGGKKIMGHSLSIIHQKTI
ncbi:hypothetical protein [Aquiflexum sp.]|uniref:hypothetical protein n=1 Tax=Aquiflexum sp. TaxID=1872584 RepID=UPI003593B4FE